MKEIQCTFFKSSNLHLGFTDVRSIQIDSKPFDSGAFGEVYFCNAINQIPVANRQVVKIFLDDGSGSSLRGYQTITKLQEKILERNNHLLQANEKPLEDVAALFALPQFSFQGSLFGRTVRGYSANFLAKPHWLLFSQIFNEDDLAKRKLLRNKFYNLPLPHRLMMAYDLVEGFTHLEQMHFIYADLNPKNFFVNEQDGSLCLIDYEGGAVNENPETFGKPGEWLAPEIQEQLLHNNSSFIKVDLNTDTWAVTIAVHFMLFNFHPLFFLKTRGKTEMREYFANNQWPYIQKSHPNFRADVSTSYDYYIHKLNSEIPEPLVAAFSETINNGFINPNKRLSYRQWLRIVKAEISKSNLPGKPVSPKQIQPKIPHSKTVQPQPLINRHSQKFVQPMGNISPLYGTSTSTPHAAPVGNQSVPDIAFFDRKKIGFGIAAVLMLLCLFIYIIRSEPQANTIAGTDRGKTSAADYSMKAFRLEYRDSKLIGMQPENGRVSKEIIRYVQPVLTFDRISGDKQLMISLKIITPGGKIISIPNLSPQGFTYSKVVDLDSHPVQQEIQLKQVALNCPKCATGTYRFEIYIESGIYAVESFEIY